MTSSPPARHNQNRGFQAIDKGGMAWQFPELRLTPLPRIDFHYFIYFLMTLIEIKTSTVSGRAITNFSLQVAVACGCPTDAQRTSLSLCHFIFVSRSPTISTCADPGLFTVTPIMGTWKKSMLLHCHEFMKCYLITHNIQQKAEISLLRIRQSSQQEKI